MIGKYIRTVVALVVMLGMITVVAAIWQWSGIVGCFISIVVFYIFITEAYR